MDFGLKDRRILVTGGSRGIGRGIALAAARAGAHVLTCHRAGGESVESLRRDLLDTAGDHHVVRADVSKQDDVTALLDTARQAWGGLDVVVNNAGDFKPKPYAELTGAEFAATVNGNLTSTHMVTQGALPLLGERGSVVNLGSTVATIGMDGGAHYTAVKAALVGLTRSLARELGPRGIRVNVVSPGRIDTEALDLLPPEVAERQRAAFASFSALGRLGTTEEIANVVLFLASDLAGYVTGQDIVVDGGV